MLNTPWRSFKTAAWLGWQIESNWTEPILFALYSIVKPLAVAGILVVIYAVVTRANFSSPLFAYMYLGNAFYTYVGAVMTGMAFAVIEDRERYQTLRSIYTAPVDMRWYIGGRGMARFLTGTVSVAVTLLFGILFLQVPVHFRTVHWLLLLVSLAIGIVMLGMMGLIISGFSLLLAENTWVLGDAVAGALYLFSGAIFPIGVLPAALRPIGFALPVTYWLELLRRSLIGSPQGLAAFSGFSNLELIGILAALTAALSAIALAIFHSCDRAARERGYLDRTTGH